MHGQYVVDLTIIKHLSLKYVTIADTLRRLPADDLVWRDDPRAWHQQMARIVDHRFSTFGELRRFALDAKKAGVSALMLVEIQNTRAGPGPWYNGLQVGTHDGRRRTCCDLARAQGARWRHATPIE